MLRLTTFAAAGLLALSASAHADPQLQRVRGTVESMSDSAITVKTDDGKTQDIQVSPDTGYVYVEPSSLDKVTDGKFIGTATKGDNPPVAIELVIFPPEMKGTGEGHYAWDAIPDSTSSSGPVKSKMTNGTIKSTSSGGTMTKSKMTNGTIKSDSSSGGKKMIDVTYDNGKSLKIELPKTAPIVEFVKKDKSIVEKGSKIFSVTAVDGDKLDGKLVAIGKGITPPM